MTSTLKVATMPRRGSASISAADLLKLLSQDSKFGFLRQKHTIKIIRTVKWRHRFVVLAQNAVYIYEHEMSHSPTTSIPLLGYIAVKREKNSTCAWVFALVPGVPSLRPKIFACSSDADRKDWMRRIKTNLYSANNVKPSTHPPQYRETENLTPEDEDYLELELPIKSPLETTSDKVDGADKHEDLASDSDEHDDEHDIKTGGGEKSVPETSLQLSRQNDTWVDNPPRYSAVVQGKEYHYQNQATTPKAKELGLEKACTIVEETINRDREKCIEMLKGTKRMGTYLIRKSRTGDYNVLAILVTEDLVKEFRIEEAYGMYHFHMDKTHEFPSIDALLAYYTTYGKVPLLNSFLVWGIHECVDDEQKYEPLDD